MIIVDYIYYGGMTTVACGLIYLIVDFCNMKIQERNKANEAEKARLMRNKQ